LLLLAGAPCIPSGGKNHLPFWNTPRPGCMTAYKETRASRRETSETNEKQSGGVDPQDPPRQTNSLGSRCQSLDTRVRSRASLKSVGQDWIRTSTKRRSSRARRTAWHIT
jgi:hypothetical protein